MHRSPTGLLAALVLTVALASCSPVFNWREARLGEDGFVALLPCKPDQGSRDVDLAGTAASLAMMGCEAGGATFSVARTVAPDPARAAVWLEAWEATMAARAAPGSLRTEPGGAPAKASSTPRPVRMSFRQTGADGRSAQLQMLWFAQVASAQGVTIYQATVLGKPDDDTAAATFFSGLRLP